MIDIVFLKFMKIRVDIFIDIDSNCITIKNASTIKKVSEIWMNETYNIIYIEPDISRWDCWAEHYNSGHCFSVIIHLNKSPEKKTRSLQPGYTGRLQSCGSSPQRIISQSFFLKVFGAEFLRFRGVVESEQLQHPDPDRDRRRDVRIQHLQLQSATFYVLQLYMISLLIITFLQPAVSFSGWV